MKAQWHFKVPPVPKGLIIRICVYIGETHSSNSRCFINNSTTPAMLRTNKTYDHFMQILDAVKSLVELVS